MGDLVDVDGIVRLDRFDEAGEDIGPGPVRHVDEPRDLVGLRHVVVVHEQQVLAGGMLCRIVPRRARIEVLLPQDPPPPGGELRLQGVQ